MHLLVWIVKLASIVRSALSRYPRSRYAAFKVTLNTSK